MSLYGSRMIRRHGERARVPLDNAAIIFLATLSDSHPKVFRLSAELDDEIDPVVLQKALDETFDRYPLFHAVVRPGAFWYALEDSDLRPVVTAEPPAACAPLYRAGQRTLLFRVLHHRRRIVLETFHGLTDGTGALWFLSDLVAAYVRLRHPGGTRAGRAASAPEGVETEELETVRDLVTDSFATTFRRGHRAASAPGMAGPRVSRASLIDAASALLSDSPRWISRVRHPFAASIHHVGGVRTSDHRARTVELTVPVDRVLTLARAEGVSLTMYLTALFFASIRSASGGPGRVQTLSASVAVDLRRVFPSVSARNFFAVVHVEHTYGRGPDDLGAVCRQVERLFRARTTPAALARKVRGFVAVEELAVVRAVPRRVKDPILRLIGWSIDHRSTVAVSNLGRVVLPEPAESHVGRLVFHVPAVRPQIATVSHAGLLTITFASPFVGSAHVEEFIRLLAANGVEATTEAARVPVEHLIRSGP